MNDLFTNHQCPNCKGVGFLPDGGNVWDCEDCKGKGVVSSAYIIWAEELAKRTEAEAASSDLAKSRLST